MKVKVRNTFRDKSTKKLHRKNTEMVINSARFAEINGTPAGFLVEEIKIPDKKKSKE